MDEYEKDFEEGEKNEKAKKEVRERPCGGVVAGLGRALVCVSTVFSLPMLVFGKRLVCCCGVSFGTFFFVFLQDEGQW
jgi:hypothetical protein